VRFSFFAISRLAFSTGGYSAEYGEALSSVLLLNRRQSSTKQNRNLFNDRGCRIEIPKME
jgi:hypothetical protein